MKIAVHLRHADNQTNMRSLALAKGLNALGQHSVVEAKRDERVPNSDLVIQTGFARSVALTDAIERRIPYLIMETPVFRGQTSIMDHSSFTYNGLAGGGTRATPLEATRPSPTVRQPKNVDNEYVWGDEEYPQGRPGKTLIIGQKPTDHSLRGHDHVKWILQKFDEYPDADFRHHPLMVDENSQEPLKAVLPKYDTVITFNSTAGIDALIQGCNVVAEHEGSEVYDMEGASYYTRMERIHELSYAQFSHSELNEPSVAEYILSGYDVARYLAADGHVEHPREKVDGSLVCKRYYTALGGP